MAVSDEDYEIFRHAAAGRDRSIAQLIREAMSFYRAERLEARPRLGELPVFLGHAPTGELPSREELYDEIGRGRV